MADRHRFLTFLAGYSKLVLSSAKHSLACIPKGRQIQDQRSFHCQLQLKLKTTGVRWRDICGFRSPQDMALCQGPNSRLRDHQSAQSSSAIASVFCFSISLEQKILFNCSHLLRPEKKWGKLGKLLLQQIHSYPSWRV